MHLTVKSLNPATLRSKVVLVDVVWGSQMVGGENVAESIASFLPSVNFVDMVYNL